LVTVEKNTEKENNCMWQLRCIATWVPDVAPLVLGCFWPNLYCACAQTANSELSLKILTPTLDSATPISYMVLIFWQSASICYSTVHCWPYFTCAKQKLLFPGFR